MNKIEIGHFVNFRTTCPRLTQAELNNINTQRLTFQCRGAQYFQHCRLSHFFVGL